MVITLFLIIGLFGSDVFAATHDSLLNQPSTTIAAPPVLLQAGTAGASTIYANSTSAKVSVSAPITQGWLANFQYRKKITFNNSAIGENLVNFTIPIIFNSSNTDFWGHVQTNGNDTRFVASDNTTELYYEFEKFNHTSDDMVAWVKVPQINAGSTTDSIWVYYGNSTVNFDSYSSNSSNVWDDNYIAVWHLKESPTASAPQFKDSKNGNNGTANNMVAGDQQSCKIDGGLNFNGVNTKVPTNAGTSVKGLTQYTVSAWVNTGVVDSNKHMIYEESRQDQGLSRVKLGIEANNQFALEGRVLDSGNLIIWVSPTTMISTNTWYNVAGVFDSVSGVHHFMINGTDTTSTVTTSAIANTTPFDTPTIGARPGASEFWSGRIDEVRISNIARSANWNKACYQYETGQSKFTYGSEEQRAQDPVLNVVNQVTNAWNVSLKVYNSSNIVRISNAIINLHDGTSSDQIVVNSGSIIQSQGALYNLPGSAGSTVYIGMSNLLANATGASYLYVYLKILMPNTTTYSLYVITFEID
jgi:hypothetical protein